ncbi:MAG: leucine-rich repeat domain-containing protein [Promethearchaeota archaeon]
MELKPNDIYEKYSKKIIDKVSAIEQLSTLIESSNDIGIRVKSIEYLSKIGKNNDNSINKDEKLFHLFENLLISDSNDKIRNLSAQFLKTNFLEKAFEPMIWALHHDSSPECLIIIFESLINIIEELLKKNDNISKNLFLAKVKQINEKEFRIGFEKSYKKGSQIITKELAEILINYFCFIYLQKTIWRLKVSIENCRIVELDFLFKGLSKLPEPIKYLKMLKKLVLRYNQLTIIPDWIGSLIKLESLNLNINNIIELPETIGNLISLKEFLLWKNELNLLPDSIGSLRSLEKLNLRLNQISSLPSSFGNLLSLKELNVHDNRLNSIPESIGSLRSLEILNLSWNEIEYIPESIGSLSSLKTLDLERNKLASIPNSLGNLNSLIKLNLNDNKLIEIPQTIGNLKNLEILNLSRNNISELPNSLNSLTSLKEIYLAENSIKSIPRDLKLLEKDGLKIYI